MVILHSDCLISFIFDISTTLFPIHWISDDVFGPNVRVSHVFDSTGLEDCMERNILRTTPYQVRRNMFVHQFHFWSNWKIVKYHVPCTWIQWVPWPIEWAWGEWRNMCTESNGLAWIIHSILVRVVSEGIAPLHTPIYPTRYFSRFPCLRITSTRR